MTLLQLGQIAAKYETEMAHAMLFAVAVAKGYCLMCGNLRDVYGGVCRQCQEDARVTRNAARLEQDARARAKERKNSR